MSCMQRFKFELFDRLSDASLMLAADFDRVDENFYLEIGEFTWTLDPEQARGFASLIKQGALRTGVPDAAGVMCKLKTNDGIEPGRMFEIGIADDGLIYVAADGAKIFLDGPQGEKLLTVLGGLADADFVAVMARRAESPPSSSGGGGGGGGGSGSAGIFNLALFDGPRRIMLTCHRLFEGRYGRYLLRGDGFETLMDLETSRRLANAGWHLALRAKVAGNGPMKPPGLVFERRLPTGGVFELGITPDGLATSIAVNGTQIDVVKGEDQHMRLHAALADLYDDVFSIGPGNPLGLAQTQAVNGVIQSNLVEGLRNMPSSAGLSDPELQLPRWAW